MIFLYIDKDDGCHTSTEESEESEESYEIIEEISHHS